ncbi:Pr6Pr family membrane protein [Brevibacterium samyangense]|uniref:Integral membrane protein n=1 Tax=Brevibacterium samyangense TaxID=366888 RepID=A0ABN2TBI3_9MICO
MRSQEAGVVSEMPSSRISAKVWAWVRIASAVVLCVAVFRQGAASAIGVAEDGGSVVGYGFNFVSYFTNESNLAAVVMLVMGGVALLRGRDLPVWFGTFRVVVVTCMATTGIVYNALLRGDGTPNPDSIWWANEVLHVVGPVLVVLDGVFGPGVRRVSFRVLWWVAGFPVVWAIYTMLRAPIAAEPTTGEQPWYPYPFLDPAADGVLSVVLHIVAIAGVIVGVGAVVVWGMRLRVGSNDANSARATVRHR